MAYMGNVLSFINADGLPPKVVSKLNNNFWEIVRMITTDEVNIVSASSEPKPRTDETLWYKADTGDLYIWRYYDGDWGWGKLDIEYIHVDQYKPADSSYTRNNEYIWISTNSADRDNPIYIWAYDPTQLSPNPRWVSLRAFIEAAIIDRLPTLPKSFWLNCQGFIDAVEEILDSSNS